MELHRHIFVEYPIFVPDEDIMKGKVLFICSGNFYRSRYAELLFNHLAYKNHLDWEAFSCGTEVFKYQNEGSISTETIQALLDIPVMENHLNRFPVQIDDKILEMADIVIALKKAEHKAPLVRDFPHFEKKVVYWQVHDLDGATPEEAFTEIRELVGKLVEELKGN
jgi:protein-tyrosine phosphatase